VPGILNKLQLTFEQHTITQKELNPIQQQIAGLLEQFPPAQQSCYPCLRNLMRILRKVQLQSETGRLLYLRVLCDVAQAQGKPLPKHPGTTYLDLTQ